MLFYAIDRYPVIDMVISARGQYSEEKAAGLYVVPPEDIAVLSGPCDGRLTSTNAVVLMERLVVPVDRDVIDE